MLDGFMKFIMRGNVLDLAVGVIIGAAFGALVNSLVTDVLTPLIGLIFQAPDFSGLKIGADAAGKGGITYGKFINAIIAFLLTAFAVYFFIITPMNRLQAMIKKPEAPAAPATPEDIVLLREIRDALKK